MNKAVEKAFLFLSMRDHTVAELVTKLTRTFSKEQAEQAAEYLVENGYINEENIAMLRVEAYKRGGKSKKEMAGKLRLAGIDRQIIEELCEDVDESEIIEHQLARKYASRLEAGSYKKVTDSLLRRGFSYEKVRAVMAQYLTDDSY